MDDFDSRILEQIQRDNRLSVRELAQSVGLSPGTCQKRVRRLRDEGFVAADIAVLDPAKAGRGLILIVEVELERERQDDLARFKQRMIEAPEVMQCYYVTGKADYILILSVRDMTEFEAFTQRYFFEESNVTHFTTSVAMDRVKMGLFLPVAADEE